MNAPPNATSEEPMVYCVSAQCPIPESLCRKEQEAGWCGSCTAVTRHCTACGAQGGVTDGVRGYCDDCARAHPVPVAEPATTPPLHPDQMIARVLPPLSHGAARHDLPEMSTSSRERRQLIEQRSSSIFRQLLQHARPMSDGAFRVQEAVRTIAVRGNLTLEDANFAMSTLLGMEGVSSSGNNMILDRQYAQQIEEIQDTTKRNAPDPIMSPTSVAPPAPSTEARTERTPEHRRDRTVAPDRNRVSVARAVERPKQSAEDAARLLIAEAVRVEDDLVVRGAIPLLQHRLAIGAKTARTLMERFAASGGVVCRDGFRVVAVNANALQEERETPEPAPKPEPELNLEPAPKPETEPEPQQENAARPPRLRLIRQDEDPETISRILTEVREKPEEHPPCQEDASDRHPEDALEQCPAAHDDSAEASVSAVHIAAAEGLGQCIELIRQLFELIRTRV